MQRGDILVGTNENVFLPNFVILTYLWNTLSKHKRRYRLNELSEKRTWHFIISEHLVQFQYTEMRNVMERFTNGNLPTTLSVDAVTYIRLTHSLIT